EQDRFGPADIAIGVPDGSVTPFLEADLDDKGLTPFDPSGKAIKEHPIYLLLDTYRTLLNEGSYAALGAFLRNADILDFLQNEFSMLPLQLLEEFDEFQNRHLPMGWEDIGDRLAQSQERDQFGHIEKATGFVKEQIDNFQNKDLDSTVRLLLQTVYQFRMVNPQNPDDKEFIAVAQAIDNSLQELASESINNLEIEKAHAFDLLLRRLAGQRCYVEYEETEIDLEGWLELSWNNAPILIVTCMNDGQVPESHLDDIFLPDSLRTLLNLRHDSDRLATDAFLMRTLIESRNTTGRACFIAGKTSSTGDPLKPSRLLFHCSDEELPERAKRLFGDPQEKLDNHPATIGFPLQVTPPADIMPEYLEIRKLPVTAFKDYLACPFRFYLKHVLGMEGLDDQKTEMDSLDFGALIHEVLQEMAENSEISKSENEQEISQFLHAQAKRWVKERFGETPPLPVQIQLDSAKQRLSAAARVQTQLVREGWQIKRYEMKVSTQLNGMDISGRIDRIDQHRETGRLRILDYKTSDRATMPQAAHMGSASPDAPDYVKFFINGKEKSWIDLQLPLYRILLPEEEFGSQIELGYFNLPKAIGDTGITIWEEMGIDHLDSARHCAENVIEGIRNLRFWPPAARVKYDDFENLFPAEISDCIDEQPFEAFMKRPK
ncbi:MAG: hypothetical protein HOC20_14575, partial [Chloroflexi bacterium]|nr:hypothetical protein [Chloroflexota bacterium]